MSNCRESDKPSRLGDDHLGAERVELAPQIAVVQRHFDVLVRALVDARRRRRTRRRRQHVPLGVVTASGHAGRHGTRVVPGAERAALTCVQPTATASYVRYEQFLQPIENGTCVYDSFFFNSYKYNLCPHT